MSEISVYWSQFIHIMNSGGAIMWMLFALNLLLWYGIGYRYLTLRRGSRSNVRRLIGKHLKKGEKKKFSGLLDYVVADSIKAYQRAVSAGKKPREFIYDAIFPYVILIKKYSILVKTIVILAPLVGLLGTVVGMIETFNALETSSMFSQGDSIAGGISKALFTTELGLVVAVPGLIIGKILDRKEEQFMLEFEQIVDILSTKDSK